MHLTNIKRANVESNGAIRAQMIVPRRRVFVDAEHFDVLGVYESRILQVVKGL